MEDETLRKFDMRLTAVEGDLKQGAARFERLEKSHDLNTAVTLDTRAAVAKLSTAIERQGDQLTAFGAKMAGPVEVYENAVKGLSIIGRFGELCVWLGRRWWLVLAVVVALKVWWTGGSWGDVWHAMSRMLTVGPER